MGIKIGAVRTFRGSAEVAVTVQVGDEALHLMVRPDFYTYDVERTVKRLDASLKAQQAGDAAVSAEVAESLARMTIEVVASWDLEDEAGEPYELTLDGIARVPVDVLMWVWTEAIAGIKGAQAPEA